MGDAGTWVVKVRPYLGAKPEIVKISLPTATNSDNILKVMYDALVAQDASSYTAVSRYPCSCWIGYMTGLLPGPGRQLCRTHAKVDLSQH